MTTLLPEVRHLNFDFDEVIERRLTNCSKWDRVNELFGSADVLPMWVADMDFAAPPVALEALQKRIQHSILGYVSPPDRFFQSVIDWSAKRHHYLFPKEALDASPGVVPSLGMLVRALTNPGETVIIQPPVYPPFTQVVLQNDRKLVTNPLVFRSGHYEMDLEDFERKVQAHDVHLLILCSPHNPVGRVWTTQELTALGDICKRHGVQVIADEIHADLILPGHTHTPFAALSDFASFTATCVAPSKTFNIAGLQTSFTITEDENMRERFRQELARTG
ncbi:MAG: PatB family C-S lyase, partial [Firmicutes bacterium]|nr:PatB family C-S lyase [Bacillota bacterium]